MSKTRNRYNEIDCLVDLMELIYTTDEKVELLKDMLGQAFDEEAEKKYRTSQQVNLD